MYVTRHDWLYHEVQLHQKIWTCIKSCETTFESPNDLKSHLLGSHPGSFSPDQLSILSDMCERPIDPGKLCQCALCGAEMSLRDLNTHVASHLEEIALFVLPVDTDESASNLDSHHAERPRGNDAHLENDDLSSLGSFTEESAADPYPQDVNTFSQGLKMEEEAPLAQIEGWFKTDDPSNSTNVTKPAFKEALPLPPPLMNLGLSNQESILPTKDPERSSGLLERGHGTGHVRPSISHTETFQDLPPLPDWRSLPEDWDGLPSGWEKGKDSEGRRFYLNTNTAEQVEPRPSPAEAFASRRPDDADDAFTETMPYIFQRRTGGRRAKIPNDMDLDLEMGEPTHESSEICKETVKLALSHLRYVSDTLKLCDGNWGVRNTANALVLYRSNLEHLVSILTQELDTRVNPQDLRKKMILVIKWINNARDPIKMLRLELVNLSENDRKKPGLIRRIFDRRDPVKEIREYTANLESNNTIIRDELDSWELYAGYKPHFCKSPC